MADDAIPDGHERCREDPFSCPTYLDMNCTAFSSLDEALTIVREHEERAHAEMLRLIEAEPEAERPQVHRIVDGKVIWSPIPQAKQEEASVQATPPPSADAEPELPFRTPEQILEGATEDFDPVIPGLAYRGLKTLIVAQSKAGKSYTTWAKCAEAVRAGKRVLYLSEEPEATVKDKLRTFGLEDAGDRFIITRRSDQGARDLAWVEIARRIETTVRNRKVDCVVVDTARAWFGLAGDESNSADVIGQAFDVLSRACDAGTALVVLHQAPWDKKRARNSTEFHAASDLIFVVSGEGKAPRMVKYLGGRVEEGIPEEQTIRYAGGIVEDLGSVRRKDAAEHLGQVLTCLESDHGREMTAEQIADESELHVKTVRRCLKKLEERGKVIHTPARTLPGDGGVAGTWKRAGAFMELYYLTSR